MTKYEVLVILSNVYPTKTWQNFNFGKFVMWIGTNDDQRTSSRPFEQCFKPLQFDLITLWSTFHVNWGTTNDQNDTTF